MTEWQSLFITLFSLIAVGGSIKGFIESKKGSALRITHVFWIYGAFVYADMAIFGLFWAVAGVFTLYLQDWYLFLLILSLFWLVRSIGETMYWFNQQFSTVKRNPPEKMFIYKFFRNDSVWFVYQIFWQCITVTTAITTLYIIRLWL